MGAKRETAGAFTTTPRPLPFFPSKKLCRPSQTALRLLECIGTLIEKTFEGGRELLGPVGVPIESLAVITSLDGDKITFADERA